MKKEMEERERKERRESSVRSEDDVREKFTQVQERQKRF